MTWPTTTNNPHADILEDGKQGALDPAVAALKTALRPAQAADPGKMRSWRE